MSSLSPTTSTRISFFYLLHQQLCPKTVARSASTSQLQPLYSFSLFLTCTWPRAHPVLICWSQCQCESASAGPSVPMFSAEAKFPYYRHGCGWYYIMAGHLIRLFGSRDQAFIHVKLSHLTRLSLNHWKMVILEWLKDPTTSLFKIWSYIIMWDGTYMILSHNMVIWHDDTSQLSRFTAKECDLCLGHRTIGQASKGSLLCRGFFQDYRATT